MAPTLKSLRIGTRGSLLARAQTNGIKENLALLYPELAISVVIIETTGDLRRDIPFNQVGTKGMFVKEIEQALLDNVIDVGVHSLKDMPSELPQGLTLACFPKRENPFDALISREMVPLAELPDGSIVGTSSARRHAQLSAYRPSWEIRELRGNLDTRLRKLDEGQYDAIILACAGLNRLGLAERITEPIDPTICVPAVGQGALALEIRRDDTEIGQMLAPLNDANTEDCVRAERAFLRELEGGCSVPAGAYAKLNGDTLTVMGVLATDDGTSLHRHIVYGHPSLAVYLGADLAKTLRG